MENARSSPDPNVRRRPNDPAGRGRFAHGGRRLVHHCLLRLCLFGDMLDDRHRRQRRGNLRVRIQLKIGRDWLLRVLRWLRSHGPGNDRGRRWLDAQRVEQFREPARVGLGLRAMQKIGNGRRSVRIGRHPNGCTPEDNDAHRDRSKIAQRRRRRRCGTSHHDRTGPCIDRGSNCPPETSAAVPYVTRKNICGRHRTYEKYQRPPFADVTASAPPP